MVFRRVRKVSTRFILGIILGSAIHFNLPNSSIDFMHRNVNQRVYNWTQLYEGIENVERGTVTLIQANEKLLRDVYTSLRFTFPLSDVSLELDAIRESLDEQGELTSSDISRLRTILFDENGQLRQELFSNNDINLTSTMLTSVISANEILSPLTDVIDNNLETPVVRETHGIATWITEGVASLTPRGRAALEEAQRAEIEQRDRRQALIDYQNSLLGYISILRRLELLETEFEQLSIQFLSQFQHSIEQASSQEVSTFYLQLIDLLSSQREGEINLPEFQDIQNVVSSNYQRYIVLFEQIRTQMSRLRDLILIKTQNLNQNEQLDPQIEQLVVQIEESMHEIQELLGVTLNNSLLEDAEYNLLVSALKKLETLPISLLVGNLLTFLLFPGLFHLRKSRIFRRRKKKQ